MFHDRVLAVHENRRRPLVHHRIDAGRKRQRRHPHLVPGPDARHPQGQMNRGRARRYAPTPPWTPPPRQTPARTHPHAAPAARSSSSQRPHERIQLAPAHVGNGKMNARIRHKTSLRDRQVCRPGRGLPQPVSDQPGVSPAGGQFSQDHSRKRLSNSSRASTANSASSRSRSRSGSPAAARSNRFSASAR